MTDPYGTIDTRDDGSYVLRYERAVSHPIEKVWAALTDPDRLEEWWARAEVELSEGGRARLEWLNGDAVAEGRITRLDPPRAIEFDTRLTLTVIDFLEDALDGRPVDWANWPQDVWERYKAVYEASMRPIS